MTEEPQAGGAPQKRSLGPIAYGMVGIVALVAAVVALTSGGEEIPPGSTTTAIAGQPATDAGGVQPTSPGVPAGPAPITGTTPSTDSPIQGTPLPPTQVTTDRNPLNGEPLTNSTANRVIAVKVDNVGDARPQLGLIEAEMIIETPVEGGLTRFTALYFNERPRGVGPVRSIRPVDADLLAPFHPILVFTGGQDFVYRDVRAAGIETVDATSPELFQAIERVPPHDRVASVALIAQQFAGGAPPSSPFPFGDGQPLAGEPNASVRIPFSSTRDIEWHYDGERYVRYENGEVFGTLIEAARIETVPLTTDTVLVLSVAQRSAGYQDSAGADVPTFDVIGFGRFMAFSGGTMVTGEWRRAAQSDGYFLIGSDGSLVRLPVGKVFVEIVPRTIEVTTAATAG